MKVIRSGYYSYRKQKSYQKSPQEIELGKQIREVFFENRRRYGSRRIKAALQNNGIKIVGREFIHELAIKARTNSKKPG
jgi:HTH-like domain